MLCRLACTVQVLCGVLRGVDVVDVADGRQVQASCCARRGQEQCGIIVPEALQRLQSITGAPLYQVLGANYMETSGWKAEAMNESLGNEDTLRMRVMLFS